MGEQRGYHNTDIIEKVKKMILKLLCGLWQSVWKHIEGWLVERIGQTVWCHLTTPYIDMIWAWDEMEMGWIGHGMSKKWDE